MATCVETHGGKFIFNEIWDWNESERFDVYNNFVDLRGGCAGWMLKTSDWYFPGTPNNKSLVERNHWICIANTL